MLLRAEDQAKFEGRIDDKGATVWASYRIEGRVEGKPVVQSDKRMFASEQEARTWLVGEAEERGFKDFEPGGHAGGVTLGSERFCRSRPRLRPDECQQVRVHLVFQCRAHPVRRPG